jgi:hypothetical protein
VINTRPLGISNLRNLARVESVSVNTINLISSSGVTSAWFPECTEISPVSPSTRSFFERAQAGVVYHRQL